MPHRTARRTATALTSVLGAAALSAGLLGGLSTSATAGPAGNFPDTFPLPDGFQPEGITIAGRTAYFGSRADGDLYRVDLRTGEGERFSEGPGTPSVGLKISDGRLFVSGGTAGTARVVDAGSGEVLADYTLSTGPTFVNDVVVTDDAAYFTDSQAAVIHVLPLGDDGALPTQDEVTQIPLSGDWEQVEGFNANGIDKARGGDDLLVVNSTTGLLHRVDTETGETTVVDLGDTLLTNGDGILRQGRRLYVVQNRDNVVTVLALARDSLSGEQIGAITDDDFDAPTTVARKGNRLYLPNARFSTEATPETEYDAVKVSSKLR